VHKIIRDLILDTVETRHRDVALLLMTSLEERWASDMSFGDITPALSHAMDEMNEDEMTFATGFTTGVCTVLVAQISLIERKARDG
jgi:hypothetical protein